MGWWCLACAVLRCRKRSRYHGPTRADPSIRVIDCRYLVSLLSVVGSTRLCPVSDADVTEMDSCPRDWAGAQDLLRETMPGFEERPEQNKLALAIERNISEGQTLIGQAGCGTGKSVAALVPAIASGERVVYSTATKALQSQIFTKDLPFLQGALFPDMKFAMLKGRSNYVCHARLQDMDSSSVKDRVLAAIDEGYINNDPISGERDSIGFDVDDQTWRSMTISSEDCPGRGTCPFGMECLHGRAVDEARESNVVVVNHALVMQDAAINIGSVIGEYKHLIVDEAHELEEYATSALTGRMSVASFTSMANNCHGRLRDLGFDFEDVAEETNAMALTIPRLAQAFFAGLPTDGKRIRQKWFVDNADEVGLIEIINAITPILRVFDRAMGKILSLDYGTIDSKKRSTILAYRSRLANARRNLTDLVMKSDAEVVRFVDDSNGSKNLMVVPVSVADRLPTMLWDALDSKSLISATLLVDGSADYIKSRLGVESDVDMDAGTPFDYSTQSMLYIPRGISEPTPAKRGQWEREIITQIENLVASSRGRALVLFTSTSAMNKAFSALTGRIDYPMRKQGDAPLSRLVDWFRDHNDAVLFGTRSLFTGLDVQGDSLSLVIIDKLPFPVPTEPVYEARAEDVKRRGGDDFGSLTIPMMALPLQQAFGRLIRTKSDRGVVAILDPRVVTKGYGKKILRSLPGARLVDSLGDVHHFFQNS